jgi:hypothetical protein
MKRKGNPIPTTTSLVEEAIRLADDFVSMDTLITKTGRTLNQVSAALWHLRNVKVIDSLESGGKLWWFYNNQDQRSRVLEERIPEDGPQAPSRSYNDQAT